jgi:hypothetical protein
MLPFDLNDEQPVWMNRLYFASRQRISNGGRIPKNP